MSSYAVDAAMAGAVYNSPALARDLVQTAAVGSVVSATDAARQAMPAVAPAASVGYGGTSGYATALANTSVAAQEQLMTLASQNQLLETMARSF